jgi:ribosomal protein S12 methylthiotransferase
VDEVAALAADGYQEVILVAQDTTAYGRDRGEREGLADLLEAILQAAPELPWLRLMYTYPQHITDRLIEVMANHPQVCHYVDLPLQHAHPDVLRRMRRPSDVDAVARLLEQIRAAMPDVALRTAFIVGYPGETDDEFEALVRFVEEMRFDHVGAFVYSPEPGTYGYGLQPWIPDEVKEKRRDTLLERQQAISLSIHQSLVGREMEVLLEGAGDGISVGRTYRDAPEVDGLAIITGELQPGQIIRARVRQAMEYDLLMDPITTG